MRDRGLQDRGEGHPRQGELQIQGSRQGGGCAGGEWGGPCLAFGQTVGGHGCAGGELKQWEEDNLGFVGHCESFILALQTGLKIPLRLTWIPSYRRKCRVLRGEGGHIEPPIRVHI